MRRGTLLAAAVAVALTGTTVLTAVQFREAREADQRADELASELEALRREVERLESERAEERAGGPADPFAGILGDLFGGDGLEGLGDLGGLLGDLAGGVPGAACLLPDGADPGTPEDMLAGLLGGTPGASAPDDPAALVSQTADQVADLRELAFATAPEVTFLDDDAIRARLGEIVERDYPAADADVDARLLTALGAIPPGSDMHQLQEQILGDQVAGFYDPATGELVVRTPGDGIGTTDRVTLAHELQHALADQALGLPDLDGPRSRSDQDAALATLAVIEGDATLLMNQWTLANVGLVEQLRLVADPSILAAQSALEQLPPYLVSELLFPYTAGLDHVCARWVDGGWAAVDAAYADSPTTTAEVLWPDHPGREGEPAVLAAPAGHEQALTTTFGAAPLLWLLEAPGGDEDTALDDAEARARAWAGGRATVWTRGAATVVGVALVDGGDGPPLCDTMTTWYAAAFPDADRRQTASTVVFDGPAQDAAIRCGEADVRIGIAADVAAATRVVGN